MTKPTESVTEERARRILAKAIEVDSREFTTIQDLEVIARDLGISAEAFHAALKDEGGVDVTPHEAGRGGWMHKAVLGAGIPLGFAVGRVLTTSGYVNGALAISALMIAGLAGSAALIALERTHPTPHRFVFRNTVLWAGVAAGSMVAIAMAGTQSVVEIPWMYTLPASLRSWFVSALLGAVAVAAMRSNAIGRDSSAEGDSTLSEPVGWIRGTMRAVRRMFNETVERNRSVSPGAQPVPSAWPKAT